jgi:hypothetical protein
VTALPPSSLLRRKNTHRLIPSKYRNDGSSVLTRIAADESHLADIFELEGATNDRLLAENERLVDIGMREFVFGVPSYRIVNATFAHPNPLGSRFNDRHRGAWYAAFELKTAQAEIIFHKSVHLAEIGRFEDDVTVDDYLADFAGEFHDLRDAAGFVACLARDSYVASQELAERLLAVGSLGVIYPSVRRTGGTCVACFWPALVTNVRRAKTYRLRWEGKPTPTITN